MSCKWNGSEQPRTIPGRHADDCPVEFSNGYAAATCPGCLPCDGPHDARGCDLTASEVEAGHGADWDTDDARGAIL